MATKRAEKVRPCGYRYPTGQYCQAQPTGKAHSVHSEDCPIAEKRHHAYVESGSKRDERNVRGGKGVRTSMFFYPDELEWGKARGGMSKAVHELLATAMKANPLVPNGAEVTQIVTADVDIRVGQAVSFVEGSSDRVIPALQREEDAELIL